MLDMQSLGIVRILRTLVRNMRTENSACWKL